MMVHQSAYLSESTENEIDFFKLRTLNIEESIKSNKLIQEKRSRCLLNHFLSIQENTYHARIIIGAGIAGTALYSEIPYEQRIAVYKNKLPFVLVLNDSNNANQWQKDLKGGDIVMARKNNVQNPQLFSSQPYDYNNQITVCNPYGYVMTSDFNAAQVETQNDLGMPILNFKVIRIELRQQNLFINTWEHIDYPYRIVINLDTKERYLYTKHVDLCTGIGLSRKLSDQQINSSLAEKLKEENKLIYSQDYGNAKLTGKIVFYGGSARNATIIGDIILKKSAAEIIWVSRNEIDFERTKNLSRLYFDIMTNHKSIINMQLGTLDKIEKRNNGKLKLSFSAPRENGQMNLPTLTGKSISCNQLVVGIGQEPNPLMKDFIGFFPYFLENQGKKILLGTSSKDKGISIWGAAGLTGVGLSDEERNICNISLTDYTSTLPSESHNNAHVSLSTWAIKKMVSQMRKIDAFPINKRGPCAFDLPDINQSTFEEIMHLIKSYYSNVSIKEVIAVTTRIIDYRSKHPCGIRNAKKLITILKDDISKKESLLLFVDAFFPFRNRNLSSKKENTKIKVSGFNSVLFKQLVKNAHEDKNKNRIMLKN